MYLAWAAFYEGNTDDNYFRVLLPRLLDDLARNHGGKSPIVIADYPAFRAGLLSRNVEKVAEEICEGRESFDLLFVHADQGGRGLAATLSDRCDAFIEAAADLCGFQTERAIKMCPRHETEAWALADRQAICEVLGFNGNPIDLGLPSTPRQAEKLPDPKAALSTAIQRASGRRKMNPGRLLPLIAQAQRLSELRRASSFAHFENQIVDAMTRYGFMR